MKRALLFVLLLAVALALGMLLLPRHVSPALAVEPPPKLSGLPEPERSAVKLSYVEFADSPHRTEQPGATQVYGWITRGDDGQPASSGTIRLRFQNYATASGTATEEQADSLARSRNTTGSFRDVPVQEDGGWVVDLPGKCWIWDVEYIPSGQVDDDLRDYLAMDITRKPTDLEIFPSLLDGARLLMIRTRVAIDLPLEHGAVELSFQINPCLQASGFVFDAPSGEPIEDAQVVLQSTHEPALAAGTGSDGAFRIIGIDPGDLELVDGMITFLVQAPGHKDTSRKISWERGQSSIPAFKVVLNQQPR